MAELTKEYLDKQFEKQGQTIATLATKQHVTDTVESAVDELAGIVNSAFDKQNKYLEEKFVEVIQLTKIRERLDDHERKFRRLETSLNIKF